MATFKFKNEEGQWEIAETPCVLKYTKQNLTEEQKAQARANIGVGEGGSGVTPAKYITGVVTEPVCHLGGENGETWTITTWNDGTKEAELVTNITLMYMGLGTEYEYGSLYLYSNKDTFPLAQKLFPTGFSSSDIVEVSLVGSSNFNKAITPTYNIDNTYNSVSLYNYFPVLHMGGNIPPEYEEELSIKLKIKVTKS